MLDLVGDPSIERVLVLTQPRVLGYVFNPVSFYWCYRARRLARLHGRRAEQHVRRAAARGAARRRRFATSTRSGCTSRRSSGSTSYEYAFSQPGDEVWARIHVRDDDGARPLTAVLHGRRRELTERDRSRGSLAPLSAQPLQVTALIHWQALRLWLKRVPFHHKPPFVPGEGSMRA